MQYMGSKNKIAKHLLPVMLAERKPNQVWVEPFVGGANMIDKVDGWRIGNDNHKYLIALLSAVQNGWVPPTEVSRELYYDVKEYPGNYSGELVGFVGFLCSFGGKWWGGYAKNNDGRNYAAVASRHMVKQAKHLIGIEFVFGRYLDMEIPDNSLIYCDPPYANTTEYKSNFDHDVFWQWCRDLASDCHTVFVSEYYAPEDFECVKIVDHETRMDRSFISKRVEKLFVYAGA